MNKSVNASRIKPSKIVTVIAAVLMVALIVAAIVLGVNIPRTTRIKASDGGKISSLIETDNEEWYLSTQKSNVMRMNAKGETVETLNITELVADEGLGDVGYVRSLNMTSRASDDLYVYTSTNHLIQLREKEGKLTYNGAAVLTGTINAVREKDGYLYVLNSRNKNMQISKFDVDNLSDGALATGYVYKPEMLSTIDLVYLQNITVLSFEIVEQDGQDYVHILYPDGLIRFTTDFALNGFQDELSAKVQERVQKRIEETEGYENLTENEKVSLSNKYTEAESAEVVKQYADKGVVGYNAKEGRISFDFTSYLMANSYLFNKTEEAFRGCGYDKEKKQYYLLTKDDNVYVCPVDNIPVYQEEFNESIQPSVYGNIVLPYAPKAEGSALFYDDALKVGYVAYNASNRLSRIDFNTGKMTFTTKASDDIRTLIQNSNGQDSYYIYLNKNEAEAGEFVLRHIGVENQESRLLLEALMTVSIVFAVVAALVVLLAALCAFKPGFSEKFVDTMRLVKKHWAIYVVIAASFSLVAMFCYYPAIGSIALSFFDYTVENESKIWNNFSNYIDVFTSSKAGLEFGNMLLFLASDVFTALLPPLVFAFFLTIMRNKKYSAVMRTLLFIPGVIPGIATTLIWKSGIYDYPNGVINMVIQLFQGKPFDFMHDKIGTRISIIMMGFPFVGSYLIFYGAMMNVPDSYYEAAELDGITVVKRFVFIDVPLIVAQIKYVLIMTFISSVQNFGRTYMTDQNNIYDTNTPIHTMYNKIQTEGNYGLASAYATVLFVILFAATVFNMYSQKRDGEDG